jgi:hypothetical protein
VAVAAPGSASAWSPCPQELIDGHADLLGVAPVGVVDLIAQLGRLRLAGRNL